MLEAALLGLFNMGRGNATISHGQWLILAGMTILSAHGYTWQSLAWFYVVIVITILRTRNLLDASNGDLNGIWKGLIRNSLSLPALWYLHSWLGLILMMQPIWYWGMGRITKRDPVRLSEGVTGEALGMLISYSK